MFMSCDIGIYLMNMILSAAVVLFFLIYFFPWLFQWLPKQFGRPVFFFFFFLPACLKQLRYLLFVTCSYICGFKRACTLNINYPGVLCCFPICGIRVLLQTRLIRSWLGAQGSERRAVAAQRQPRLQALSHPAPALLCHLASDEIKQNYFLAQRTMQKSLPKKIVLRLKKVLE